MKIIKEMKEVKKNTLTNFLIVMGANPTNRILDFLIENGRESWAMTEIRDNANVSYATVKTLIPKMEKIGLIISTKVFGKSKFYTINKNSQIIQRILSLHREIINNTEIFIKA